MFDKSLKLIREAINIYVDRNRTYAYMRYKYATILPLLMEFNDLAKASSEIKTMKNAIVQGRKTCLTDADMENIILTYLAPLENKYKEKEEEYKKRLQEKT